MDSEEGDAAWILGIDFSAIEIENSRHGERPYLFSFAKPSAHNIV
jgi:hypothetical protein